MKRPDLQAFLGPGPTHGYPVMTCGNRKSCITWVIFRLLRTPYNVFMRRCFVLVLFWLTIVPGRCSFAQAFDLAGPKVDVHVKRGELTLPIGEVPNLLPGDRLWIHPDLPESQSAHYVLVVAFLRGVTNPPPPEWFTRVETWTREAREEGVFVVVPNEAQQAILFLAPATGGDFSTLRNTVRGRPGMFVRADQDLQIASWDRMRLDAYLDDVKNSSQSDPKLFKERAETSARSLGIKVNQDCFYKPIEEQASCLSAHTEGLVMDDSNAQTRVAQLTGGSAGDLMNQLSYSTVGGAGAYSPYIGAIVDTAKILSSLHTAHYQYIPALALPTQDTLNLRLSVPPSFRDPKSVVVVALPAIGSAQLPQLHPVNPSETFCAQKPGLVLPAEGAPLALSTRLAHDLRLHIETKGKSVDLPLTADPAEGGLVVEHPAPIFPVDEVTGVVRGKWGFDEWDGPHYLLRSSLPGKWKVLSSDELALVVGRDDSLHVEGVSTLCVQDIKQVMSGGEQMPLTWKSEKENRLEISVPMKDASPGAVKIAIRQYGLDKPDTLTLTAYSEAASLNRLSFSSGDAEAELTGTRLDEVAKATLKGVNWTPAGLTRVQDSDKLAMKADSSTEAIEPGTPYSASVQLRDGRELKVPVTVEAPRPQIALLSKGTQDQPSDAPSSVKLGSTDDLPVERRLVFFLKSKTPANFPRTEKVEIAAVDGSFHTVLSLSDGSLMLEDAKTALGVVEHQASIGSSAFGPVEARAVSANNVAGDWLPLGTLVRLPGFKELRCPRAISRPCLLTGSNLFLATSLSATPEFDNPIDIPPDFTGTELAVPHPTGGNLYLKLRDDPATVQTLLLPVLPMPPGTAPPAKLEPSQPAGTTPNGPEIQTRPAGGQTAQPNAPHSQPDVPASGPSSGARKNTPSA